VLRIQSLSLQIYTIFHWEISVKKVYFFQLDFQQLFWSSSSSFFYSRHEIEFMLHQPRFSGFHHMHEKRRKDAKLKDSRLDLHESGIG
jgi:hypothetical protein